MALIAHYKLDEPSGTVAIDAKGSVDGTITGGVTLNQTGSPASPNGKAMLFDGVDGSVNFLTSDHVFDRLDTFSFSAWINTSAVVESSIFTKRLDVAPFRGYSLELTSSGLLSLNLTETHSADRIVVSSVASVNTGVWVHVTATYSGISTAAGVTLYIDGIVTSDTTVVDNLTGSILDGAVVSSIGSRNNTATFFDGLLDDVRVYDHELTAQEVEDLFTARVTVEDSAASNTNVLVNIDVLANDSNVAVPTPAPLAHYKLDETTGTTAIDSAGTVDGTITGGVTLNQAGSPHDTGGKSMSFDGVDGLINLGDNLDFDRADALSISYWINTTSSANMGLIAKATLGAGTKGYAANINTLKPRFVMQSNGDTNKLVVDTTGAISSGVWTHVTITKSTLDTAAGINIYVDGVSQALTTVQDNINGTTLSTNDLTIGDFALAIPFDGSLDDVRIYDTELTAQQVLDLYNYTVPQITIPVKPIAHYKLDETTGTTANSSTDNSSFTIPASFTKGAVSLVSGGSGTSFDSTDSTIVGPVIANNPLASNTTESPITISMWINLDTLAADPILISQFTSPNDIGWIFGIVSATNKLSMWRDDGLDGGSGGAQQVYTQDNAISVSTTHHVVCVIPNDLTPNSILFYVDGVQQTSIVNPSFNNTITAVSLSAVSFRLLYESTNRGIDGRFDDLRIYDVALTATQVEDLYNYSAPALGDTDYPSSGVAVLSSDRLSVDYTSDVGFTGIDTFQYDVDNSGSPATVTVTVTSLYTLDNISVLLNRKPLQSTHNSIIRHTGI